MSLKSKIILNALFGAIGGFLGWAVTQTLMRGFFAIAPDMHQPGELVLGNIEFGFLTGLTIGGMLGAAEALWSRSPGASRRALLVGCAVGAVGGILGLSMGQSVFDLIAPPSKDVASFGDFALKVFGRALGWAIIGLILGAAQGATTFSAARARHGAIGGLVGGFIGGMSFDVAANILRHDSLSRMISLTLTGFTIGFMIGLIQNLLKPAWIVIVKDRNEGREIPIYKPVMTIGRDELADIPVFQDRTVLARHAVIKQQNNRHVLEDGGTTLGTSVNGQKVAGQMLKDRDVIEIGTVRLLFRERATASRYAAEPGVSVSDDHPRIPNLSHVCPFCGGVKDANGNCECTVASGPVQSPGPAPTQQMAPPAPVLMAPPSQPMVPGPTPRVGRLVAVAGPHASMVFALQTAEVSIGREAGRDIFLPNDNAASRRHARIVREDQGFVLYDEGSSNGTFVNGGRITRAVLTPGDTITIGGTELRFEA
jgi:pSer/pThr/pTyr-binding forkhead associated (FHA) protein